MENSMLAVRPPNASRWIPSWNEDLEYILAGQLLASSELTTNAHLFDREDMETLSALVPLKQIEASRFMSPFTTEHTLVLRPQRVPEVVAQNERELAYNGRLGGHDRIHNCDWEKRKSEIRHLYVDHNIPLPEVVRAMERKGFKASQSMYKRRFQKWGWAKYVKYKPHCQQYPRSCANRLSRAGIQWGDTASGCTTNGCTLTRSNSQADFVQSRHPNFNLRSLEAILQSDTDRCIESILHHTRSLYISSLSEGRWEELNDDGLLRNQYSNFNTSVHTAVKDMNSSSTNIGMLGLKKIFKALDNVVGDCDIFSLPAIWESWRRLNGGNLPGLGNQLLVRALQISQQRFGSGHPQVRVLAGICELQRSDPDLLEIVILHALRSCICHLENVLSLSHPATLMFWVFYLGNLDTLPSGDVETVLLNLRHQIQRAEEENGVDDNYTLGILECLISLVEMTGPEAEFVSMTNDMLSRVNRRLDSGEKLDGRLLIYWYNANYDLGWRAKIKGDLHSATQYLDSLLMFGIKDAHDAFVLQDLEAWYAELGDEDNATRARELRFGSIYALDESDDP